MKSIRKIKYLILVVIFLTFFSVIYQIPYFLTLNDSNLQDQTPKTSNSTTTIIRPNYQTQIGWEDTSYNNINDNITQPTQPDGNANLETRINYHTDIFEMGTNTPSGILCLVTKLKLWFYGCANSFVGNCIARLTLDVKMAGKWLGKKGIQQTGGWFNKTYYGNWLPTQVNDIQIKAEAYIQSGAYEPIVGLDCVYLEITYKRIENHTQDIDLFSPENTYSSPMRGYYPATYGFENGDVNSFIDSFSTYGNCEIANSYKDNYDKLHNYVLHVEDDYYTTGMKFIHTLDFTQDESTIEFWFLMTNKYENVNNRILFYVMDTSNTIGFRITMEDEEFIDSQSNTASMEWERWYNIKIDFDCTTTKFDWSLDGTLQYSGVSFEHSISTVEDLVIRGHSATQGEAYFDAFGFNWEHNFNIGDNLNEGLFLEFDSDDYEWMGYSKDGQVIKTIYGSTVIPYPEIGTHTIEVFGEDSSGYGHTSGMEEFEILYPVEILSPQPDHIYQGPMEGYYPATYGFENDEDDTAPDESVWDETSTEPSYAKVISEYYDHKKILQLHKSFGMDQKASIETSFDNQIIGDIEFWFRAETLFCDTIITLKDSVSDIERIKIRFSADHCYYYDGNNWVWIDWILLGDLNIGIGEWNYMQISFDGTIHSWTLEINDKKSKAMDYTEWGYNIDILSLSTLTQLMEYDVYFDAFGFSWDEDYVLEDNKYEGILLDFIQDDLVIMKYSIDGSPQYEIPGTYVLPIFSGAHTVQVFGWDQYENEYESDHISFSIELADKIGVLLFSCQAGHDEDALVSQLTNMPEYYIHYYKTILITEGYTKFYIIRDINMANQLPKFFERMGNFRIDSQDSVFVYLWGHGRADSATDSKVTINYYWDGDYFKKSYLTSGDFFTYMETFDTDNKGFLVDACESGGFTGICNLDPYVGISSSSWERLSWNYADHEGIFSHHFWEAVLVGYNARGAFAVARENTHLANYYLGLPLQEPQITNIQPNEHNFFNS